MEDVGRLNSSYFTSCLLGTPPSFHWLLHAESQAFIEGLSLIGSIQFQRLDTELVRACDGVKEQCPGETAAAVSGGGQDHADPSKLFAVTHQRCGGHQTAIGINAETILRIEAEQHAPVVRSLAPSSLGRKFRCNVD